MEQKQKAKDMMDFPFLNDDNTIQHVKKSKVMMIMRGLPGSGKSTVVKAILHKYKKGAVACSADDHFLQEDGSYAFQRVSFCYKELFLCKKILSKHL